MGINKVVYQDKKYSIEFGTTVHAEYQVVGTLGRGSYGEVNKCIHLKSKMPVAIKSFY